MPRDERGEPGSGVAGAVVGHLYDGRVDCQAMAGAVVRDRRMHNPWRTKYRTEPLKHQVVNKLNYCFLDHAHIKAAIEGLPANPSGAEYSWICTA